MGELGGDGSLDDLAAIIDWMRKVEGKSWQQVATALGEREGFVRNVTRDKGLGSYKRIRRLRARAVIYARRKMETLVPETR